MPEADTGKALRMLDLLLEFFGENGEHWTRGRYDDGHGRRCLIGALQYASQAPHSERRSGIFSAGGNARSDICAGLFQ